MLNLGEKFWWGIGYLPDLTMSPLKLVSNSKVKNNNYTQNGGIENSLTGDQNEHHKWGTEGHCVNQGSSLLGVHGLNRTCSWIRNIRQPKMSHILLNKKWGGDHYSNMSMLWKTKAEKLVQMKGDWRDITLNIICGLRLGPILEGGNAISDSFGITDKTGIRVEE